MLQNLKYNLLKTIWSNMTSENLQEVTKKTVPMTAQASPEQELLFTCRFGRPFHPIIL